MDKSEGQSPEEFELIPPPDWEEYLSKMRTNAEDAIYRWHAGPHGTQTHMDKSLELAKLLTAFYQAACIHGSTLSEGGSLPTKPVLPYGRLYLAELFPDDE